LTRGRGLTGCEGEEGFKRGGMRLNERNPLDRKQCVGKKNRGVKVEKEGTGGCEWGAGQLGRCNGPTTETKQD